MSQLTPKDTNQNNKNSKDAERRISEGEATYYFDEKGVNLSSGVTEVSGLIPSVVSDHIERPLSRLATSPRHSHTKTHDEEDSEEDHLCGIGPFHPAWVQRLASKKAFMIVFSLLAIIQTMAWSYFTATITTLEKRFKISSQTAGIVMTGNEISQITFSLILAYCAGQGHRPRWMSVGVLISALGCFLLAAPHFLYGPGSDALSLTEEYAHLYEVVENNHSSVMTLETTTANPLVKAATMSHIQLCRKASGIRQSKLTDCEDSDTSVVPFILIFVSQFVSGIGVLLFYTLGGPYLDDNVEKTQSPLLFGIGMSMRLVGPTIGFIFAGFCLKLYISPMLTPTITLGHPQWLGAWWLGWVVLGILMILTSVLIAMFPRELPRAKLRKQLTQARKGSIGSFGTGAIGSQLNINRAGSKLVLTSEAINENAIPRISEMHKAVAALITNKVNLFNNMAAVFYVLAAIGYWTYMPKYLETIFMQTAVNASVISGVVSILFQAIGLLVSGALISKYQPSARFLAGWNVVLGFIYVIVKLSFTQMGCDPGERAFGALDEVSGEYNLTTSCNLDCNCKTNKVFPVCHRETNQMYYSACHAGCSVELNGTVTNCSCVGDPSAILTVGTCNEGCSGIFLIFLGVNAMFMLVDSSGRIGNMLVSYRCVDPKDKSLAIGFSIFLISVLAMLPSPIMFGKIFDSACLVWGTKCGARGNCWLYDGPTLRYWFNLVAAAFTFLGAIFDCLVWYYVKDLDLYDEDKNVRNRALENQKLKRLKQAK